MFYNNLKIISKSPFIIFKIDNFLNPQFYEELRSNFPLTSNDQLEEYYKDMDNKKFHFNSNDQIYEEVVLKSLIYKKFHEFIFQEKFAKFFINKFRKNILFSRFNDLFAFSKLLRPCKYNKKIKSKFFQNIQTRIEFSYVKNNGKLRPHTDNKKKLISLMLYFPDFDNDVNEKSLGTVFYESNQKNYKNKHLDFEDEKIFKEQSKILYKTLFEKNCLYGFIRNNKSWHSLDVMKINNNYIRKSININFFV